MLKRSLNNPRTEESSSAASARIRAYVRNTLLASPEFPRLYADVVLSSAPNSNEAKILARNYKKIVAYTNAACAKAESTNMSGTRTEIHSTNTNTADRNPMTNVRTCTHIRVTGARCGSPALRGERFCYFHQRMLRTVKGPPATRVHHAALLEDEESIQASLMEVVNALLRGSIEVKRAELILRALNTAVRNIRRVNFSRVSNMITQIPEYPAVPDPEVEEAARAEIARQATRAEIARIRAEAQEPANLPTAPTPESRTNASPLSEEGSRGNESCGDGSSTRPSGPELPGRSTPSPKKEAAPDPTKRKPPVSVKREAPKERKMTAHGASRG